MWGRCAASCWPARISRPDETPVDVPTHDAAALHRLLGVEDRIDGGAQGLRSVDDEQHFEFGILLRSFINSTIKRSRTKGALLRRIRSFSRAFARMPSSWPGRAGTSLVGGGGFSSRMALCTIAVVLPENAIFPVAIS